jgi:glycosyltransferase involved in cell wall biosynthesis
MKTPTLYLTRNGLLEPLGQSQVFNYLRGLSRDYAVTLMTREKPEDWENAVAMSQGRAQCDAAGIVWRPKPFQSGNKGLGAARDLSRTVGEAMQIVKANGVKLVHARAYFPSAVAWYIWRRTGTPFIFDMRALWPEELIAAGRLKRGSLKHRAVLAIERACLRDAAAVVSLTHAAIGHLRKTYPRELESKKMLVIPTCADLDRFVPGSAAEARNTLGCLGTLTSGWFKLDWLASFLDVAARMDPDLRIELTTRDNESMIRQAMRQDASFQQRVEIAPASPENVPKILRGQIASVMFFTDGLSKIGSSPTRMGEVLGCGIPVVANDGVGDVARIVQENRVGVIVKGSDAASMEAAWRDLQQLRQDPNLAARCRETAEKVFSLETGTRNYAELYAAILASQNRGAAE